MAEQPLSDASAQVATDPFWSAVRRRHPDADIVLLPERPSAPVTRGLPAEDPDAAAVSADAVAEGLWALLAGDLQIEATARWRSGPTPDTVQREVTFRSDGVDPVTGVAAVSRGGETLTADGWHVLIPADGLPRALAGRDEELGRREAQLVHDPAAARLILRVRSAPVLVGERAARAATRGAS